MITDRPRSTESPAPYMHLVPDGDLVQLYTAQVEAISALISGLSDREAEFRYADEKWSIKEVLGHLVDTERVFCYRLLCAARADTTPMPSFDEDDYVVKGTFHNRPVQDLLDEWETARKATISMLKTLSKDSLHNLGTFKNQPTTALTVACVGLGHTNHHINILNERYKLTPGR